jgi:hypothetical protein
MTGFSVRGRNNGPRRVTGEFGSISPDEAQERKQAGKPRRDPRSDSTANRSSQWNCRRFPPGRARRAAQAR